ncbi:hypothetical protein ACWGH4_00080 [Streptomyces sp. NPDC054847]
MSVFTLPATAQTVDHSTLPPWKQALFDQLIEQAQAAGTLDHFTTLMADATRAAGLPTPSGEITKCACTHCYCTALFDPHAPDAHAFGEPTSHNLGRQQCPACADDHLATVDD